MIPALDTLRPPELGAPHALSAEPMPFALPWHEPRAGVYVWLESQDSEASQSSLLAGFIGTVGWVGAACAVILLLIYKPAPWFVSVVGIFAAAFLIGLAMYLNRLSKKDRGRTIGVSFDTAKEVATCERIDASSRCEFAVSKPFSLATIQIHPVEFESFKAFAAIAHVGNCGFALACQWDEADVHQYLSRLPAAVRALVRDSGTPLRLAVEVHASAAVKRVLGIGKK